VTLVRDDVRRGVNDKLCTFVCLANSDKDTEINALESTGVGEMGK